MTSIVWFRRDLRVRDHPALKAALAESERVVPVFCLDDRLLHGRHASGPRTQFMLECLTDLDGALRERGGRLVIRRGRPEDVIPALAREVGAHAIHVTYDVSPFARSRGTGFGGTTLHVHPGLTVVDHVGDIRPYQVFSAFHRVWEREPRRDLASAPRRVELPDGLDPGAIPSLAELGLAQEVEEPMRGGEREARRRLKNFLAGPIDHYEDGHDALGEDRTSRLSPYLHFGCISPLEIDARASSAAFRRQLAWRDFYHHVLLHHPGNARDEFQERYRGTLDWEDDADALEAWKDGRTGFPLVDAGMRQLAKEGWMHNRARLVVGSFLTKDLGIDWREGERHFMRLLIDGDEANNNGNWQWIASVGVDPAPFFRRLYNPARHMERYDPRGAYVRRHVPELRDVPLEYLAEPWTMPEDVQRASNCAIGRDYPGPVVDRREARERAIRRYRLAAGSAARAPFRPAARGSASGATAETSRL
ncbi:MAG: deoxyribodipyrimidine photo-lyase [Thermoleophilaceae bacterium]|nr:deoxyribodipyrimidine photo-lyase [Thermoleophilaceae bacterium]